MTRPLMDRRHVDPVRQKLDALSDKLFAADGNSIKQHDEKDWFLFRLLQLENRNRLNDESLRRLRTALVDPLTADGLKSREAAFQTAFAEYNATLQQQPPK